MKLKVIVDNKTSRSNLSTEHGQSILISTSTHNILMDTGQSGVVLHKNLLALKIDPESIDCVVITHGHYDHAGGLLNLMKLHPRIIVHMHPDVPGNKYAKGSGGIRSNGTSFTASDLEAHAIAVRNNIKPSMICDSVHLSGPIPGPPDPWMRNFFKDGAGTEPDLFEDEQFLFLDTDSGGIVVTGCCHRGVINSVRHAMSTFPQTPVTTVVGGFHLNRCPVYKLDRIWPELLRMGVRRLYPNHCTGDHAVTHAKRFEFDDVMYLAAGQELIF